MRHLFIGLALLIALVDSRAQIDIEHYQVSLDLFDTTDIVQGTAHITVCFKQPMHQFALDLVAVNSDGKGMHVTAVHSDSSSLRFGQEARTLTMQYEAVAGDCATFRIEYSGIPADGLIISENKYGDRTFFGDNWPNRAHNWFPCVDHPADKATFAFIVAVPAHYQVVASGSLMEETDLPANRRRYHWATDVALPAKVAVFGAARFAVQHLGEIHDIPVSTWVYPQNRAEGFHDFAIAKKVMDFFIEKIGPYPYAKIANVQSKTRFGGMENASNVFYFEGSVTGKRQHESLIAHELAHQWFGNSATESDWSHIWLSEGFATYLTQLYIEHTQGHDAFVEGIARMKRSVIHFAQRRMSPVVDSTTTNYMQLLNTNSYQKGALVLHMLRRHVGEDLFWEILRTYYARYKLSNASTRDFQKVAEKVSSRDLRQFFDQWLFRAGHPRLQVTWQYAENHLQVTVHQKTPEVFTCDLDLAIELEDGTERVTTLKLAEREQSFAIPVSSVPVGIALDPGEHLLFELVEPDNR